MFGMALPSFQPMTLARTREPFDHADFVFELKYDGFRALAYVDAGTCRLVSRKNHVYKSYTPLCEWIGTAIWQLYFYLMTGSTSNGSN